ncbi:uncharacterized protein LOC134236532 [Saccostrea cucullata]|uniref:uncharacterized protein LOC134236532 n=1 Tax=Saccostrea cuccullata TaxID=36930 RepID=UPI002ED66B8D
MKNTESVDTKSTEKRFKDEMRELQKTGIPKLRELYAASEILEQEVVLILPEFGKILHIWPMLKEITENNPLAIEVLCEEKTPAFRRLDKFCLEDDDWKEFIDLNKDHKRCFDKRFLNDFQVFKSENFYPDLSPLITCERKNFSVSEIVSCFVYGNLFRTQLIEKYVSEHQQDDILKTIYEKLVDYETYIGEDQLQKLGNLQEETEREEYLKTIEAQALAAHLTKRKITSKGDFLSIASIFSIDLYICAGEMKQLIRPICTKINQVFHGHLILFLIPDSESSFTVDCYPSHSCFCKMETPIITGVFSDIQEEILPEINKKINSSSKCCCKPWWPRKSHTHLSHFQKWFHPDIIKNNFRRKKPFVNVRHKNQSEIDKKLLDFLEEDGRTLQQVQSGTICECLAKEVYGTTTVSSTEKIRNTICANDNDNDDTILEKAAETLKTDIFVFKYSLEHSRWVSFHPKERRTRCHFYITLLQIAEEDSLKYNRIIPEEGCNCRHLPPETPYFITKDGIKTDCLTIPREDLECHSHVKILLKDFKTDPQADYFCDEQRRVPLVSFTSEHAIVLSHPEMEDRMIDHISDISFSICKCISKEIFGTEGKFDLILDHLISEIVNNKHLYVRLLEEIQQKTTIDIEMVVNLLKDGVEFEKIELSAAANYYQWPIYTVSLEESNGDCAVKWIEYKPNTEQANEDYYMTFFKASAGYFNRVTCKDANNVCNCRLNKPNETEESQGVNKVWKRRELQQLWGPVNHLVKLKFNFENWIRSNIALEILCLEFVKTLEERRKGTNIASIVGSSTSLIGTILMVSGILASPVTGGATLALTIAGGVISGGGTITTIGAKVAEFARNKKPKSIVRRQQMVLQEHSRRFEKIVKELDKYLKILEEKNREKFTASLDVAPAYLRTFCSIGSIPLLILRVLAKAITSAEAVFIPASVLADGVIIGIAANSLRKGSKTDDSKKLRTAHILLKLTREQMNIWAYGNTYKGGSSNDILKEKAEITTQNEVN